MNRPTLYVVGAIFLVIGLFYLAAATGIAFEDRLSDSSGGPWLQGLFGVGIGVGAFVWASRLPR